VIKGLIFDIKRFAVHDGPGIRTTIFFKGCPLSCGWCHNPESRFDEPQTSVRHLVMDGREFKQEEITGREVTVEEIVREVSKDRIFYEESGGGITLSGGEPLFQIEFCEVLLKALSENGFHTAIDTTGYCDQDDIQRIIPFTDLFLYDLKLINDTEHKKHTGVSNRLILENLEFLTKNGKEVIIRFPVIPGITDSDDNIEGMVSLLLHGTMALPEVHLLPYHSAAKNKYQRFRMDYKMEGVIETNKKELSQIKRLFEETGFIVKVGG
jgi:pyruvate formate lyase activating enzyme